MYIKSQERKETTIKLKYIIRDAGLKVQDCAAMMGVERKTFYNKVNAGAFSYSELVELLDKIGYDIIWVKRNNESNHIRDRLAVNGLEMHSSSNKKKNNTTGNKTQKNSSVNKKKDNSRFSNKNRVLFEKYNQIKICDFKFTTRTVNCLRRRGIESVADIFQYYHNKEDLSRIDNFGEKSINELIKVLEDNGIDMGQFKTANYNPENIRKRPNIASFESRNLEHHKITKYPLSSNAFHCLHTVGIETVYDMFERYPTRKDILQIKHLGVNTLNEIINIFEGYGFDMSKYKK